MLEIMALSQSVPGVYYINIIFIRQKVKRFFRGAIVATIASIIIYDNNWDYFTFYTINLKYIYIKEH